jgi:hypothetical protein
MIRNIHKREAVMGQRKGETYYEFLLRVEQAHAESRAPAPEPMPDDCAVTAGD